MKIFKTFIFYPVLIGGLTGLASGHRLFKEHNSLWTVGLFFFVFVTIYIPLVFGPYYEEVRRRK
jgi:hypothetical protein